MKVANENYEMDLNAGLPLSKEQPVHCKTDEGCKQHCIAPEFGVCSVEGECECVPGPTKSTTVVQDANSRIV